MLARARTLLGVLTVRQWWTALGLVLLLALLWRAGRALGWPATVPLAGTVVLLAASLFALLADRVRAARRAADLESAMRAQAQDQLLGVRPERREQIEQVEREFAAAVETLKASKIGARQPGRSALYALPWYAVIGPSAAGKTTAITESGLDFPLGTNRVRGIGGTRNCDWFFSTSAILLDTAGRYMTEEEDREEWLTFLGLLRRHRGRAPLNGVLVVVSVDELIGATAEARQRLAGDLRRRIDELVAELGVRFPLYLVFTKCDLVRGFTEFFADLGPEERAQVWGCTLPHGAAPEDAAGAAFAREFDVLARGLVEWRTIRLSGIAADPELAREVYLFPLEFASLRETLAAFVGQLLHPNPYQDAPRFRGFYFTSALQAPAAIDRVVPEITSQFQLPRWGAERRPAGRPPAEASRSYFLGSLLRDVVVRDRDHVAPTSRAAAARDRVRRGALAATAACLVGFAWFAGAAYGGSAADLRVARDAVAAGERGRDLRALDSLERAIALLGDSVDAGRRLRRLGLDRSARVLPALRAAFVRSALPHLGPRLVAPIEARLGGYTAAGPEARHDLRAYLLLGPEVGRLRAGDEREFLRGYLRRRLGARAGDSVYTDRFVDVLDAPVLRADPRLVARVRALLYAPPTLDGLYAGLRDEGARRLPPVPIARLIGRPAAFPFDPAASVPGLFTKAAWEGYVQAAVEQRSREPGRADWVIGARPDRLPPELADPDSVANALLQRYFADYVAAWRDFVGGVRYAPGGVAGATRAFQALGAVDGSPLVALLDSVGAQTRFENAAAARTRSTVSEFTAATLRKLGYVRADGEAGGPRNPVDRAFAPLHALRDKSRAAALNQVLGEYQAFGRTLQALAPDLGGPTTAGQLTADAVRARLAVAQALPDLDPATRAALFERPFTLAEAAVSGASSGALAAKWRDQVCRPFRSTLAGKYPFAARGPDAAPAEVERYFQPQAGTIWAFFERELASSLSSSDFQPIPGRAGAVSVPPEAVAALRRARRIRDGLFAGGGLRVEFTLTPRPPVVRHPPPGRSPFPTRVCIAVGGQRECYNNGTPFPQAFVWPAPAGRPAGAAANGIVVSLSEAGQPAPAARLDEAGDWGWFRLLDRATITPEPAAGYRLTWDVPHEAGYVVQVVYLLSAKGSTNPLAERRSLFSQFECPSAP
jgi:type VI secretion system protein ImpL